VLFRSRVSSRDETVTSMAACRNVEPRVLQRSLQGDLDWIVLKALEKEPDRRYSTVAELAEDLDRYLENRPVVARPASMLYLTEKFVRRHRVGVTALTVVLLALVALGINISLQSQRVARERDRANHEATVARGVKEFLIDIFLVSDPHEARGNSISAREILDRGAEKVSELEDDATRAELTSTLAAVYQNLGLYDRSDSLFVAAMDIWLESEGLRHTETLLAMSDVASVYRALGRLAEAESLFTVAIDGWGELDLTNDLRALNTRVQLANVIRRQGRYAEAESVFVECLERMTSLVGADDLSVLSLQRSIAFNMQVQQKYAESAEIYADVLRRRRRLLGDDHPTTLSTMSDLGFSYTMTGRFAEAESLLVEAHENTERVMGREHPRFLITVESLANLYLQQDDIPKAEGMFVEVYNARRRISGEEHPSTLVAMHNLAEIQYELGDRKSVV